MSDTDRHPLGDEAVADLLAFARLDLSADRRAAAAPVIDMVTGLADSLDEVELGETPPAAAFDARWE